MSARSTTATRPEAGAVRSLRVAGANQKSSGSTSLSRTVGNRTRLIVGLAVLVSSCEARQKKGAQDSSPSASSTRLARAAADAGFAGAPRYRVFHVFPKDTRIWSIGSRLVACESSCMFEPVHELDPPVWRGGKVPRVWLIDTEHVEEDASLLPGFGKISVVRSLRYAGHYPDDVIAIFRVGYDEFETDMAFRYLGHGAGKRFVPITCPDACSQVPPYGQRGFVPSEPRCREGCEPFEIYDAEERGTPGGPDALLFGSGGPFLVIDRQKMAVWNGASWVRAAAPWCSPSFDSAVRLSNGASLVRSDDCGGTGMSIFWISPSGQPTPIDLTAPAAEQKLGQIHFQTPLDRDREIWLVADTDAGTALLAPVIPSEVMRPRR